MTEKLQKLDELKHEVEAAQTAVKSKDNEIQELKDKLEEFIQKLRESRDKIQKSEEGMATIVFQIEIFNYCGFFSFPVVIICA